MERYSAIQCNKVWYSMIQYNTIQYDTTRYNPMCYSKVLFCVILIFLLHHVNGAGNTITRTQIPQLWYKTKSTKGYCTNAWGWHKLAFKTTPFVLDTLLNYKGTTVSFKRFFFFLLEFTPVHLHLIWQNRLSEDFNLGSVFLHFQTQALSQLFRKTRRKSWAATSAKAVKCM